jgi:chaperonin GroEL
VALINAMAALDDIKMDLSDEDTGVKIVRLALDAPMKMISENAGKDGAVIVEEIRRRQKAEKNSNIGYDVIGGEFVDMYVQGIIDPLKVTRSAVQNAASIAAMILTTEALVTDIPEKREAAPPPMPEY